MGYWSTGPFGNDTAFDWLALVVGNSGLGAVIEETLLERDAATHGDEIRAAAELLVRLCSIGIYLGNDDVLLALAERRLKELVASSSDAEWRAALEAQLSELHALRAGAA